MRIQQNDGLGEELLKELMDEIEEDRSGMHPSVSDLIGCLTKSYWNTVQRLEPTTKTKVFFFVGLGLERALLSKRQATMIAGETEGIYWHVDSRDYGLVELKSTRTSPKKHEEGDFPENWLKQMKSYCKATETNTVDLAVVYIIQADFRVFRITFTDEEIEENWEWMKERKRVWDVAVANEKAPKSFWYNQDWECKDCVYKIVCDQREKLGI